MNNFSWSQLLFQFPFRKYQHMILQQVEATKEKDTKYHIVAPPGSGKTIVGLELIKRFAQKAVVFVPTSTIQLQWKDKVKMFIPKESKLKVDDLVSLDPTNLKTINVFTYQLLSSPAENLEFVEASAITEWINDLIIRQRVSDEAQAKQRIATLHKNNPSIYNSEIAKYYKKIKDAYLRDPQFDGTKFLHANARKLIEQLAASGIKTVIMDEVHHLLDYWALVIKELLKRINEPRLVGLTATPPLSADEEELENYLSIIGSIDFEIPTPAVVKEGNLAPYQDLVYFCRPSTKEKQFIDALQDRFRYLIETIGRRDEFRLWVHGRMVERKLADGKQEWTAFFNSHPFLAVAGVKYLTQVAKENLPGDIVEIEEMQQELTLDDWVYLLTDYSLNHLKISSLTAHHQEFQEIKTILKTFGYVLTEKGIQAHRSPADMVLAYSESKDQAMCEILSNEMGSMGSNLRAVVITDFEKQTAAVEKYLEGILDPDAGGAVRAFRYLVSNPKTTTLEPVLVTGTALLLDSDELKRTIAHMEKWRKASGLKFTFDTQKTAYENIVEVIGKGPDWKSNTYVRMVTDLFDQGIIRCIVGTRGLLGEGWDSLSLNTLIDLTSATTSTTVNQVRGRSIRLDPNFLQKLANNWDIVCIEPSFERGNQDFERFMKKHQRFYGLGSKGKILKGILHIDEGLALQYYSIGFKKIGYHLVNARMLAKAKRRADAYREWAIGKPYSNFEYAATKIDAKDLKFKTVYTLKDSLKAIFRNILISIGSFAFWYIYVFGRFLDISFEYRPLIFVASIIFLVGIIFFAGKNTLKYIRKAFIEIPLDSYLLDIGKALLKTLRETQLISSSQSVDNVRVVEDSGGYYDVYLDYASKTDAELFSQSLKEVLGPVIDHRYLISRSTDTIDIGFYSPFWWLGRKIFRLFAQEKVAYHPVPDVLSLNKDKANRFAMHWKEYVGGGEIIYTRSTAGRELLLKLRAYNRHLIKRMTYEIWK